MSLTWALTDDAGLLADLHKACFPEDPWSKAAFESLLGRREVCALAVAAGQEPVGLSALRVILGEAEILTLGVAPEARNCGVGGFVLQKTEITARNRNAETLYLEVSAVNNSAKALYAKAGYREVGRRVGYYRDGADALVLKRALGEPNGLGSRQ